MPLIFIPLPSQELLKNEITYDPLSGLFARGNHDTVTLKNAIHRKPSKTGYIRIAVLGIEYMAHRLAWQYITGDDPGSNEIDHINRVRADNRFLNLQLADRDLQHENREDRVLLTYQGKTKPLIQWAADLNINYTTLYNRIYRGNMSIDEAIETPPRLTITIDGEELTVSEVSTRYGIKRSTVAYRLRNNFPVDQIINKGNLQKQ